MTTYFLLGHSAMQLVNVLFCRMILYLLLLNSKDLKGHLIVWYYNFNDRFDLNNGQQFKSPKYENIHKLSLKIYKYAEVKTSNYFYLDSQQLRYTMSLLVQNFYQIIISVVILLIPAGTIVLLANCWTSFVIIQSEYSEYKWIYVVFECDFCIFLHYLQMF